MIVKDFLEKKIPKTPGIYKFYNIDNELIYIGKSKNLNNRIRSYFTNIKNQSRKQESRPRFRETQSNSGNRGARNCNKN